MEIQWLQILFQIINFGIIAFVLIKFLYHPIAKVLEERSQKIKEGIEAAEINLAERKKLEKEIKDELAKAHKEAGKIIADAKKEAQTQADAIVADARAQAKKAAENERQAVESLISEAKLKAEQDLKTLVTATTAQVLKHGLTEADQHRIIESQAKLLKDMKFS